MDPQLSIWSVVMAMVLLSAVVAFYAVRQQRALGYTDNESQLSATVEKLRQEVDRQRAVIEDLNARYRESLISEAEANRRIRELEQTLSVVRERVQELESLNEMANPTRYTVPLLHIVGNAEFGKADAVALRKAGIRFKRLSLATRNAIDSEMDRRRLDYTPYRWVVISAHMGKDGVLLEAEGDTVPPAWWNEHLTGLELAFLNGCESLAIADDLVGLVDVVISLGEEIENRDASNFAYAFWRKMADGAAPNTAYWSAINEIPAVAEFADIRTA